MHYLSAIKSKALKNKICLLRLDFNTEDNWRMDASLPTIRFLLARCKSVVILSHKGRPRGFSAQGGPAGGWDDSLSLRPVSKILSRKLKKKVIFVPHFRFQEIGNLLKSSPNGSIFLLENLRFLEGEAENSAILAEHLSGLGDLYVNDAFAVSHRANASVVAITKFLPSYAGLELEKEIQQLSQAIKNPKKPLVVVLGGLKIEDKLRVVDNLRPKSPVFLVGGMLTDELIHKLNNAELVLPVDFKKDGETNRDIGPETVKKFCKIIKGAKTIIWNGPVGDIRDRRFKKGTIEIAKCVASKKFSIVGGGETVMFIKKLKLDKKISFISTGGGAMLDFLAGRELPGIKALE